jgi:hypothetical protein
MNRILDHLIKYEVLYVALVALIAGSILGATVRMQLHHCPECPQCPELVARSHIEREIVGPQPDTARVVKYAPSINRRTVPSVPTPSTSSDSMIAYEVIDTMPDQAIVGYSIASRELPDRYLPDLTHTAWYVAKPDRIRLISDTLTVQLPPLKAPSRLGREIAIGGICLGIGAAGATAFFLFH